MLFFFAIYLLAILWGIRFRTNPTGEYLDMDHTQAVKGIFILLVFFSHFNPNVTFTNAFDLTYKSIVGFFGQTMVTMFMFYSGYGVMESIKKKKLPYINSIPSKRIFPTLIRFDCAVIIFAVISLLLGVRYTPLRYLISLTGWESVGNSNWYIFDIMMLYLLTYIAFKAAYRGGKERPTLAATLMLLATLVAIFGLTVYYIKDTWWYDTLLCYIMGVFYSQYKHKLEKLINRNLLTWIISMVIYWGIFIFFKLNQINIWYIIARNMAFCAAVTVTTMRVLFKNKVLVWCGKHLFEIYILQRIPMMIFKHFGLGQWNIYVYFAACAAVTFALIFPFKKLTDWVVQFATKTLPQKNNIQG